MGKPRIREVLDGTKTVPVKAIKRVKRQLFEEFKEPKEVAQPMLEALETPLKSLKLERAVKEKKPLPLSNENDEPPASTTLLEGEGVEEQDRPRSLTYCCCCKGYTTGKDQTQFKASNGRSMEKSVCTTCGKGKCRIVKSE